MAASPFRARYGVSMGSTGGLGQVIPIYKGVAGDLEFGEGPGEFVGAGLNFVLIQCVGAARCSTDAAVDRIDRHDCGATALYINIVCGIG